MPLSAIQSIQCPEAHGILRYFITRLVTLVDFFPVVWAFFKTWFTQCVIVATRPLLLSALMERLLKLDSNSWDVGGTLDLTKTLITTGIKSASKTLQILSHSDSLLGEPSICMQERNCIG